MADVHTAELGRRGSRRANVPFVSSAGKEATTHLVGILRSCAADVPYVERWFERHEEMLSSLGGDRRSRSIGRSIFRSVLVDVDVDRRVAHPAPTCAAGRGTDELRPAKR